MRPSDPRAHHTTQAGAPISYHIHKPPSLTLRQPSTASELDKHRLLSGPTIAQNRVGGRRAFSVAGPIAWRLEPELSMGWVDPSVWLGWVHYRISTKNLKGLF